MGTENAGHDFPGEYRLDVEDFGPIAKASVDLRPLTVFLGPSNTGKSYLAILVYALHQCFGEGTSGRYGRRPRYSDQLRGSLLSAIRKDAEDSSLLLRKLRDTLPFALRRGSLSRLPQEADSYIRELFERAEGFDQFSAAELGRCFGVDRMSSLVRRSSCTSRSKVELSIPRSFCPGMVRYDLQLSRKGVEFSGKILGQQSLAEEIEQLNLLDRVSADARRPKVLPPHVGLSEYEVEDLSYFLTSVTEDIFRKLLSPIYRSAYYLPADRTGVMHSHQVVVSTLVQNATTAGLEPSVGVPLLSGVLADFLSQLIAMSGEQGHPRSKSGSVNSGIGEVLAQDLEHGVLKGAVRTDDSGSGYPSFDYHPHDWDEPLPLMRASSMIAELAPVVLYLRHLVRPGDLLIIEEPESHLHPAMQVEFTRQLAGLVRAGIRVIVTTHSEWVLQELANLVRVSKLPEGERAGIAGGNVALEPDQVGAWLFTAGQEGGGSEVSEIKLDHESGLYPTDFEDVAVAMHNDWARIFSRLGEDE